MNTPDPPVAPLNSETHQVAAVTSKTGATDVVAGRQLPAKSVREEPTGNPAGVEGSPQILVLGDIQLDDVLVPLPPLSARRAKPDTLGGTGDRAPATPGADSAGPDGRSNAGLAMPNWLKDRHYRRYRRLGGAWLLGDVIKKALQDGTGVVPKVQIVGEWDGMLQSERLNPDCLVSIAKLQEFPESGTEAPPQKKRLVYRLPQAGLLGWLQHGSRPSELTDSHAVLERLLASAQAEQNNLHSPLIVVHDHNLGFRDLDPAISIRPFLDEAHFPVNSNNGSVPKGVILLHMDGPLAEGRLWQFLSGELRLLDRTVVVLDAGDLRDFGVTLVESISYEQTLSDFISNLDRTPLAELARCMCVVVKSPQGGLTYFTYASGKARSLNIAFLPYAKLAPISSDPARYGYMRGYSVIMAAALAKGIHWAQQEAAADIRTFEQNMASAIRWGTHLGTALCERHLRDGFIRWEESGELPSDDKLDPYGKLFQDLLPDTPGGNTPKRPWEKEFSLATADFPVSQLPMLNRWSRVDSLPTHPIGWSVEEAARFVVEHGLQELVDSLRLETSNVVKEPLVAMPDRLAFSVARFGDLALVDRDEIDSISSIASLVAKYLSSDKSWDRPLSIAVFGPPGSGKSFSVAQIMKYAGGNATKPLEFNVSQFQSIGDLAKAFHMVQDRALSGEAPLVFFDEFDTTFGAEALGWLRYFLAPMQDGRFRDGETTFKVGRAIFVFAGGIYESFEKFYTAQKQTDAFRFAKGPDFVSRLRGHLNIPGINPEGPIGGLLLFRRAILLRAFLERNAAIVIDPNTKRANIDDGVVRAFLRTTSYEHGIRSMEAIVQMASISPTRRRFQRSSIPAAPQLAMHVDADEFLTHLRGSTREPGRTI